MRPYLSAALALALLATMAACGRNPRTDAQPSTQQQALAPGRIAPVPPPAEGPRKDYLKSQQSDARRAMDSMPAPTGGDGGGQ